MTPDQARERAWEEYAARYKKYPSLMEQVAYQAAFDAALAYVWEECGVPTEEGYFWRWSGTMWTEVFVGADEEREWSVPDANDWHPVADTPAHHWRRLRLPPPPEGE